ncbi:hypothetical protein LEN26_020452 [Aphanomyces euteiches]|nr:hypothetical protein LEN26_020452 [Aphanomyces euteiches]
MEAPRAIKFTIPWTSSSVDQRKPKSKRSTATSSAYAKPKPSQTKKRPSRPAWNDDVKRPVYFDQALANTKLFNPSSRDRHVIERKNPPRQEKKKPPTPYSPLNRDKPTGQMAVTRTENVVATHRQPSPVVSKKSTIQRQPEPPKPVLKSSSSSPQFTEIAVQATEVCPSQAATAPTVASPVRKSANQEDKDDHVAFPSFPPPALDLPPEPPRNIQLIESTFRVIDGKRRGKLHAREIHQGLQLLGITSTLRQIADYLYLVNDGRGDTIGLNEWVILVQTLQSSSWVTNQASPSSSLASSHYIPPPSPMQDWNPPVTVATQSSPIQEARAPSPVHPSPPARQPTTFQESWFIDQIERRINDMFVRAEAAVANRWTNQQLQDEPQAFLRQAASVVHGLKASLYPLVHQAEETLLAIQARHADNLSVFLSPQEMKTIATHSEVLCDLLLDELLVDTARCFTEVEKSKAMMATQTANAEQLDHLLATIEAIEAEEAAIMSTRPWEAPSTTIMTSSEVSQRACTLPVDILMQTVVKERHEVMDERETHANSSAENEFMLSPKGLQLRISTRNVAKMEERLERHRQDFLRTRRIAEATLVDTGLDQHAVIEILEAMIVDDVVDTLAIELDSCFSTLSSKILDTV